MSSQDEAFASSLAHFSSGVLLEGETPRNVDEALRHYEEALFLSPERDVLYARLAHTAVRSGDFERAIEVLKEGCRKCPGNATLHMELAAAYQLKDRVQDAEREFLAALDIDSSLTYAYLTVAALNFRAGRDDDALDILDIGLRNAKAPRLLLRTCHQQGAKFLKARKISRSIKCFVFAAEHASEQSSEIYHVIAEIYRSQGDMKHAREYYQLSTEADDPMPDAFIKLALLQHADSPNEAINTLSTALTRIPATPELLHVLGEMYRKAGQTEDAVASLTEATQKAPPLPRAFVGLAVIHLKDDPDKALEVLEEGAQRLPDHPTILLLLAHLYSFRERFGDAVSIYERVEAIAAKDDSLRLAPNFYLHYGGACERNKQFEKASQVFTLGIKKHPGAHVMRNYLAYMWAERAENLAEALVHIGYALDLEPGNAAYIDTLGWIYYQQERYPEALEQLQEAVKLLDDDPVLHDHLGDVLDKLGETEEAMGHWKSSFMADPKNENVQRKLERLGVDTKALTREAEKLERQKRDSQDQGNTE